jgi:O-antigen ligase
MGFALTLVYIIVTIVSPEQFGSALANLHLLEYLGVLTALASVPNVLAHRNITGSIQTYLMLALTAAVALSQLANGWAGGIVPSWELFLPSVGTCLFVIANVTSLRKLTILIVVLAGTCVVVALETLGSYYGRFLGDTFVLTQNIYAHDEIIGNITRLRGPGFLNDPNDFAQILLIALPLIFVAWQKGRALANVLRVLLPAGLLLWATYLTHSRGALIALVVIVLMAVRNKLGATLSFVLSVGLVFALLAMDFSGGRGISASEGAGRLESWATGLELFKSAPVFGVGFGRYTEFNDLTAHNSFVLCLAELGIVGSTIWVALIVTTMMGLNKLIKLRIEGRRPDSQRNEIDSGASREYDDAIAILAHSGRNSLLDREFHGNSICAESAGLDSNLWRCSEQSVLLDVKSEGEASHLGASTLFPKLLTAEPSIVAERGTQWAFNQEWLVPQRHLLVTRLALISFLATSWFLSRSYVATMYLVIGIATAMVSIDRSETDTNDPGRWVVVTGVVEAVAIIVVYYIVRFRH